MSQFIDKGEVSGEVVGLVEQLQEAIAHYQVSENWLVVSNLTLTV